MTFYCFCLMFNFNHFNTTTPAGNIINFDVQVLSSTTLVQEFDENPKTYDEDFGETFIVKGLTIKNKIYSGIILESYVIEIEEGDDVEIEVYKTTNSGEV